MEIYHYHTTVMIKGNQQRLLQIDTGVHNECEQITNEKDNATKRNKRIDERGIIICTKKKMKSCSHVISFLNHLKSTQISMIDLVNVHYATYIIMVYQDMCICHSVYFQRLTLLILLCRIFDKVFCSSSLRIKYIYLYICRRVGGIIKNWRQFCQKCHQDKFVFRLRGLATNY